MRFVSLLLLLPLAACDAQPRSAARPRTPLPADVLMLQRVAISDPGVIASMPAMSVLIPSGWRTAGGVVQAVGPCAEAYALNWQAMSPDGQSSVFLFPTEVWTASNTGATGQCAPGPFMNARDYLVARVQRAFPGARILNYRPRPDYTASVASYARSMQQMMASMGNATRVSADGGDVLFAYQLNGVEMQGVVGVSAIFYLSQLANPMGGTPLTTLAAGTMGTYGATAPSGALNADLIEAVRRSIVPNGAWLDRLFSIQRERGQVAVQGTRERAAIIVAGGAAATRANIESFHRMSGFSSAGRSGGSELYPGESTDDRIQRRSLEAIRGVDTYMDPVSKSPVQLDHTYGNAWRVSNQDAYILTKNPNFNPGQYGIEATQMKQIP